MTGSRRLFLKRRSGPPLTLTYCQVVSTRSASRGTRPLSMNRLGWAVTVNAALPVRSLQRRPERTNTRSGRNGEMLLVHTLGFGALMLVVENARGGVQYERHRCTPHEVACAAVDLIGRCP